VKKSSPSTVETHFSKQILALKVVEFHVKVTLKLAEIMIEGIVSRSLNLTFPYSNLNSQR
jgi:hypothetical protein